VVDAYGLPYRMKARQVSQAKPAPAPEPVDLAALAGVAA